MSQYNWNEIKAKYETGKYSMKQLAQEYGFNYKYGCRKSNEKNWEKGKSREEVEKAAQKRVFGDAVDKEAELRAIYADIVNQLRGATYKELFKTKTDFNRLKQLKISSEIMTNCKKLDWDIHKIQEVADKLEIANKEIKIQLPDELL